MAVAVAAFLALCLPDLDTYPPVGEDEPWIAAAPVKLATEGVLRFISTYLDDNAGLRAQATRMRWE